MITSETGEVTVHDSSSTQRDASAGFLQWFGAFLILALIGWLWPNDPADTPSRLVADAAWSLKWLTVLVLLGGAVGYIFRTRWTVLYAPLALFVGLLVSWFQYHWGWQEPVWDTFLPSAAIGFGALLVTVGTAAGVASRVILNEQDADRPEAGSIQLSAPISGLLGLLAVSANSLLPFPYIGALLGIAAILAGLASWQEGKLTAREQLLAVPGMVLGSAVVIIQLHALWNIVRDWI